MVRWANDRKGRIESRSLREGRFIRFPLKTECRNSSARGAVPMHSNYSPISSTEHGRSSYTGNTSVTTAYLTPTVDRLSRVTHHAATGEHDPESVDDAGRADHPRQPDEQYDAEDVLHARQVDADQRAHPGRSRLGGGRLGVRVRRARYGVRVVGDRVEESGHSRPVVHFFL